MSVDPFSAAVAANSDPAPLPGVAIASDPSADLARENDELKRQLNHIMQLLNPSTSTLVAPTPPPEVAAPAAPVFPPVAAPAPTFGAPAPFGAPGAAPAPFTIGPSAAPVADKGPKLHIQIEKLLSEMPGAEPFIASAHQWLDGIIAGLGSDQAETIVNTLVLAQQHMKLGNTDVARRLLEMVPGGNAIASMLG